MRKKLIENTGGCVVSKNILSGEGQLKWCVRDESLNRVDNGWRFFSDIDTEEYLNDADNMTVCDFNTAAEIEPAILIIYNFPVGSDLILIHDEDGKPFIHSRTGKKVQFK